MYSVGTGPQAGGSEIPEAVAMETATEEVKVAMLVAEVTEGATPDPEAPVAPEVVVGYMLMHSGRRARKWSCDHLRFKMRCRSVLHLWQRLRWQAVTAWSC
jgi:hypothetical protein